ncbi:predicted protein, partial [Nematostella vectensis]
MKHEENRETVSSVSKILGLLLAASSCVFFAISSLFVKLLGEIPPQEVVFFRSLVQLIFLLPPVIYSQSPALGERRQLPCLIVRGLAGTLALCCQFYAFQRIPLADATVIVFSSPIFTGILGYFILREAWGWFDAVATMLCFFGIILIVRPTFLFGREAGGLSSSDNWQQLTASLVALCGAVMTSIALIAIRKLQGVHCLTPVLYLAISGVVSTAIGVLVTGTFRSVRCGSNHQWLLLALGLCGIGGQTLLTKALQLERAGMVALVRTLDIVFAFLLQLAFLDYRANVYSVIGAVMVVACNVIVIASTW